VQVLWSVVMGLLLTWALEFVVIVAIIGVALRRSRAVSGASRAAPARAEVGAFEVTAAPAAPA
jgi:hypothetical protein